MTVLVVTNIDLTFKLQVMKPASFLESTIKEPTLNLNNEYRYLKTGYYVSMHAEILGNHVIPSCADIIDSSRTPILLLRAAKAGVPTLPSVVTDSVKKIVTEIGFPVMLVAVNQFIYDGYKIAQNKSALYRAMKSLYNYKFAVCAQPLALCTIKSSSKPNAKTCRHRKSPKKCTRHLKFQFANFTYKKRWIKLICVDCNP
jgi:hypothetical protein